MGSMKKDFHLSTRLFSGDIETPEAETNNRSARFYKQPLRPFYPQGDNTKILFLAFYPQRDTTCTEFIPNTDVLRGIGLLLLKVKEGFASHMTSTNDKYVYTQYNEVMLANESKNINLKQNIVVTNVDVKPRIRTLK